MSGISMRWMVFILVSFSWAHAGPTHVENEAAGSGRDRAENRPCPSVSGVEVPSDLQLQPNRVYPIRSVFRNGEYLPSNAAVAICRWLITDEFGKPTAELADGSHITNEFFGREPGDHLFLFLGKDYPDPLVRVSCHLDGNPFLRFQFEPEGEEHAIPLLPCCDKQTQTQRAGAELVAEIGKRKPARQNRPAQARPDQSTPPASHSVPQKPPTPRPLLDSLPDPKPQPPMAMPGTMSSPVSVPMTQAPEAGNPSAPPTPIPVAPTEPVAKAAESVNCFETLSQGAKDTYGPGGCKDCKAMDQMFLEFRVKTEGGSKVSRRTCGKVKGHLVACAHAWKVQGKAGFERLAAQCREGLDQAVRDGLGEPGYIFDFVPPALSKPAETN